MKLVKTEILLQNGSFPSSAEWATIQSEIAEAITAVVWPPGADGFTIFPESGKKRGEGNGVKPIKDACMTLLRDKFGWELECPIHIGDIGGAGCIDAVRETPVGPFALEWETGNISSTHRSLNKLALGIIEGTLIGGAVILPTRSLYKYLTDRVGNLQEIEPYFPFYRHIVTSDGVLAVLAVEHDRADSSVPRIPKGTDGRALL
jgi:hypothetical protein